MACCTFCCKPVIILLLFLVVTVSNAQFTLTSVDFSLHVNMPNEISFKLTSRDMIVPLSGPIDVGTFTLESEHISLMAMIPENDDYESMCTVITQGDRPTVNAVLHRFTGSQPIEGVPFQIIPHLTLGLKNITEEDFAIVPETIFIKCTQVGFYKQNTEYKDLVEAKFILNNNGEFSFTVRDEPHVTLTTSSKLTSSNGFTQDAAQFQGVEVDLVFTLQDDHFKTRDGYSMRKYHHQVVDYPLLWFNLGNTSFDPSSPEGKAIGYELTQQSTWDPLSRGYFFDCISLKSGATATVGHFSVLIDDLSNDERRPSFRLMLLESCVVKLIFNPSTISGAQALYEQDGTAMEIQTGLEFGTWRAQVPTPWNWATLPGGTTPQSFIWFNPSDALTHRRVTFNLLVPPVSSNEDHKMTFQIKLFSHDKTALAHRWIWRCYTSPDTSDETRESIPVHYPDGLSQALFRVDERLWGTSLHCVGYKSDDGDNENNDTPLPSPLSWFALEMQAMDTASGQITTHQVRPVIYDIHNVPIHLDLNELPVTSLDIQTKDLIPILHEHIYDISREPNVHPLVQFQSSSPSGAATITFKRNHLSPYAQHMYIGVNLHFSRYNNIDKLINQQDLELNLYCDMQFRMGEEVIQNWRGSGVIHNLNPDKDNPSFDNINPTPIDEIGPYIRSAYISFQSPQKMYVSPHESITMECNIPLNGSGESTRDVEVILSSPTGAVGVHRGGIASSGMSVVADPLPSDDAINYKYKCLYPDPAHVSSYTRYQLYNWLEYAEDQRLGDCPLYSSQQPISKVQPWFRVDETMYEQYEDIYRFRMLFDAPPTQQCYYQLPVVCTYKTGAGIMVVPLASCQHNIGKIISRVPCELVPGEENQPPPHTCDNGNVSSSFSELCDVPLQTSWIFEPNTPTPGGMLQIVFGNLPRIDPWYSKTRLVLYYDPDNNPSSSPSTVPPILLKTGIFLSLGDFKTMLPYFQLTEATRFYLQLDAHQDTDPLKAQLVEIQKTHKDQRCNDQKGQVVDEATRLCRCQDGFQAYSQDNAKSPKLPVVLTPFISPTSYECLPICQNNGTFMTTTRKCSCVDGYTGQYCTIPPSSSAGETCDASSLVLPTSMCYYGYPTMNQNTKKCSDCKCLLNWLSAGDSIDGDKSAACTECALRDICEGDGRTHENTFRHPFCSQGQCLCARGYTGPTCAQRVVYGTLRFTRQITPEDEGGETPRENILHTLPSTTTQHILYTLQTSLVVPVKPALVQATRSVEGTSLHTDVVVALGQAHGGTTPPADADADVDPFTLLGRQFTQDTSGNGNPYVHQDDLYSAWEQLMDNYTDSPLYTNPTDDLGAGVPNDAVYDPWCNAQQLADPTLACPGGQDPLIPGEHEVDLGPEEPIDPEDSDGGSDNTTTYIIIGVVLGVVLICFIAMIVAILYCRKHQKACYRKRKSSKSLEGSANTSSSSSSTGRRSPKGSTNPHTEMTVSVAAPTATISTSSYLPAPVANNDPTLPADWVQLQDQSTGKMYYSNKVTMESSWDHPAQPKEKPKSAYGW